MSTADTSLHRERRSEHGGTPSPRVPRRSRTGIWITAAVLVAGGVSGNAALINAVADREPVLVLARDVPWGQRITGDDVQAVALPSAVGHYAVRDAEREQVVGRVAAQNLHTGRLLAPGEVTRQVVPGPGQRVIGVRLEPGRFPARGLVANDPVAVHPAPDATSSASAAEQPSTPGGDFFARVVRTSPPDADGAVVVDLLIPDSTAPTAVTAAVDGAQVSLLGPSR